MILFLKKMFRGGSNPSDGVVSPAERASQRFLNMSAREHKKMMKRVIRRASEDQLKILQSK